MIYDRDDAMFDNKLLINLYVLNLDKKFDVFIPVGEKVGNIVKLLNKSFAGVMPNDKNYTLLNLYSGNIYRNNDLVRDTDIQNGTKLMLI